jgi:uncharacterized protein YgiM (DUF1202 family)
MIEHKLSLLLLCAVCSVSPALAADELQRVQIADPYIELHTGPGRGYPVFHVIERDQWVEIGIQKTDWFKVSDENGKQGWVERSQLERTLTEKGVKKSLRDIVVGDFLQRRFEFGIAGGAFDSEPVVKARVGYRFTPNLGVELSAGQVSGQFSSSFFYNVDLVSMPFAQWRFAPAFSIGIGRFHNESRQTLVNLQQRYSTTANVGLGLRAYLTRHFMARFDFKNYLVLVDDNQDEEFQEFTLGVSFFF